MKVPTLLGAASLFLAACGSAELLAPEPVRPPAAAAEVVKVPDVEGKAFPEAKRALRHIGLEIRRVDERSTEPAGIVLGQHPRAGRDVVEGRTVTLIVAKAVPAGV